MIIKAESHKIFSEIYCPIMPAPLELFFGDGCRSEPPKIKMVSVFLLDKFCQMTHSLVHLMQMCFDIQHFLYSFGFLEASVVQWL